MIVCKPPVTSGKDHYRLLYRTVLEQEAEWLRCGAVEKVNLLLVDDGSTEATRQIVETFHNPRIQVLRGPGRGI